MRHKQYREWAPARSFCVRTQPKTTMTALQTDIEERLADEPDVEVLLAEVAGRRLRVFIDHPDGVTLQLCERVSARLSELRERYSLEVSSPGAQRPLTKPAHFRRFVGRRARVRTDPGHSGYQYRRRTNLTGELITASDREVTLAAADGIFTIPYSEIRRCNLVEE